MTVMLPISHSALKVLKATHYPLNCAQRDDGRWNIDHVTAPSWLCGQKRRILQRAVVNLNIENRRRSPKLQAGLLRIKAIK